MTGIFKWLLIGMAGLFAWNCSAPQIDSSHPWMVYYGNQALPPKLVSQFKTLILDADQIPSIEPKNPSVKYIGYLSLGEAEEYRWYWPFVAGKSLLVETNPDWPGSHRVDPRSKEWGDLVLNQLIPAILKKGYDGLFLDTIDTGIYLQEKDPVKYQGARGAMVDLIRAIHQRYPDVLIFTNNALEILDEVAPVVSGIVVEDLYTRYDFASKKSIETPKADQQYKEAFLDRAVHQYRKPVFNILYETNPASNLADYARKRSKEKGYYWYLTTVDLHALPKP